MSVEVVPAVLRKNWEDIEVDWMKIYKGVDHVQIDVTDGVFTGDGTFRELKRFKQLPQSEKIEMHMMVQTPAYFVDNLIDLAPARCVFHLEAFAGSGDLEMVFKTLKEKANTQMALAINPETPSEYLEEYLELIDYALFMGYNPGWANQEIDQTVYPKISQWREKHPEVLIAVDGGVGRESIEHYVRAGARILCANTAIFGKGDPVENYEQLKLLAKAAV